MVKVKEGRRQVIKYKMQMAITLTLDPICFKFLLKWAVAVN